MQKTFAEVGVWICLLTCWARGADWSDEVFPIMTWELAPKSVELLSDAHCGVGSLKECGFTVAGFVRPEHLKECERSGLKAIVCQATGQMDVKNKSDDQIDQMVKKLVEESGDSPAVIGYFIRDEPGVQDYPKLAAAVAAVKKYAPGKLAYINLLPDYATLGAPNLSQLGTDSYSDYLERFVKEVKPQMISYDNYRVQFSTDLKDAKLAASYYNNLLEVRRVALKYGLPYWNIVNCNEIRPHTPVPSPANLQFQAYTSLAAGFKGVTWFKYYQMKYRFAPIDEEGHRTIAWSYLKMVNEQMKVLGPMMKKLTSTGVYFTTPAPVNGLPALPGKLVEAVTCETPVMVGEFTGENDSRWAMLVNLSLERSAKVVMIASGAVKKTGIVSAADGTIGGMAADGAIWLTAGQGVLLKLD